MGSLGQLRPLCSLHPGFSFLPFLCLYNPLLPHTFIASNCSSLWFILPTLYTFTPLSSPNATVSSISIGNSGGVIVGWSSRDNVASGRLPWACLVWKTQGSAQHQGLLGLLYSVFFLSPAISLFACNYWKGMNAGKLMWYLCNELEKKHNFCGNLVLVLWTVPHSVLYLLWELLCWSKYFACFTKLSDFMLAKQNE